MSLTLINAGPGTGKSFTLKFGYRLLSKQMIGRITPTDEQATIFDYLQGEFNTRPTVCFFAHNNTTKDKLVNDLPKKTPVFTFHGAGSSAIIKRHRYQKLDHSRSEKLISDITGKYIRDMKPGEKFAWLAVKKLVHYIKLENLEPTEQTYDYLRLKYPDLSVYQFPVDWQDKASRLLEKAAIINGTVEFVDMLWLGMKSVIHPVYDIGFVDESQDISRCAYALVTRLCKNVVFCGDKNQAINAFAGASEEMYDSIADKADAILPLKMTLRCPPFACDMANYLRPGGVIKGPNQGPGTHDTIDYTSLPEKLVTTCSPDNTLIVSRTNAAIISCAIGLHQQGIPCRIIDKDLADEVKYFFKGFHTQDLRKLADAINAYERKHEKARNPLWRQMVLDKCSYARSLLSASKDWNHLLDIISSTFEKHPDGFKLSSLHKSKGLEALNIFILNPPIELEAAMQHPIGREQEINLHFVGLTRTAMNLYWVK